MPKIVRQPGGSTVEENNVIGAPRQIRVDTTRSEIRLHDGTTPGGTRIPNIKTVQALIANGAEGAVGLVRVLNTTTELQGLQPNANTVVIVRELGDEDIFTWRTGAGDSGTITSDIDGHWRRLDGLLATVIRLWRAQLIKVQLGGSEPAVNMDTTMWFSTGDLLMYDGAGYVTASPVLFARYFASIGGYSTSTFVVPDRLKDVGIISTDLDTFKLSGWIISDGSTAHSPIGGTNPVECRMWSSTAGIQILWVAGSDGTKYIRTLAAGVWGAWVLSAGQLPSRLNPAPLADAADADTLVTAGFYSTGAATSNRPADSTALTVLPAFSGSVAQVAVSFVNDGVMWLRQKVGGSFTQWLSIGGDAGKIEYWAMAAVPKGRLAANGQAVSRTAYARLFALIGTAYGVGDGATTFNLPNLEDEFLRGASASRPVGTVESHAIAGHTHTGTTNTDGAHGHTGSTGSDGNHSHNMSNTEWNAGTGSGSIGFSSAPYGGQASGINTNSAGAHTHSVTIPSGAAHAHAFTTGSTGGAETRPRNVSQFATIKY